MLKQPSYPTSLKVRLLGAVHLPKQSGDDATVPDVSATLSVHYSEESKEYKTKVASTSIAVSVSVVLDARDYWRAYCERERERESYISIVVGLSNTSAV